MKKKLWTFLAVLCVLMTGGCAKSKAYSRIEKFFTEKTGNFQGVVLQAAVSSSLEEPYEKELLPMFEKSNQDIRIEVTYNSSFELQEEIEGGEGCVDVFMPAAEKAMVILDNKGMMESSTVTSLLENKMVLITSHKNSQSFNSFSDITEADSIAIADPETAQAGRYAREILENMGIYEQVARRASFCSDEKEVLSFVVENAADAGIVYATDAAMADDIEIIDSAPDEMMDKRIIYPVGVVASSGHKEEAEVFIEFLQSQEAKKVFQRYGFETR